MKSRAYLLKPTTGTHSESVQSTSQPVRKDAL